MLGIDEGKSKWGIELKITTQVRIKDFIGVNNMSGRGDSNSRPLRPERSALTGLRYAPKYLHIKINLLQVELQLSSTKKS